MLSKFGKSSYKDPDICLARNGRVLVKAFHVYDPDDIRWGEAALPTLAVTHSFPSLGFMGANFFFLVHTDGPQIANFALNMTERHGRCLVTLTSKDDFRQHHEELKITATRKRWWTTEYEWGATAQRAGSMDPLGDDL